MKLPENNTASNPASSHVRDDPERLAKHAIRVLEKQLLEEFGLRLTLGAELELGVLPKDPGASRQNIKFYGIRFSKIAEPDRHDPAGEAHIKRVMQGFPSSVSRATDRDPYFPDSGRISYCYREISSDAQWDMLEAVLTHDPKDLHGNPLRNDGVTMARAIEGTRRQFRENLPGYKPTLDKTLGQHVADHWRQFRSNTIRAVDVTPSDFERNKNRHGMHINMGLVDAASGNNVLEVTANSFDVAQVVRCGIGALYGENCYLVASGPTSLQRWDQLCFGPSALTKMVDWKEVPRSSDSMEVSHKPYVQNRIPDASCNPSYAILLQLAGTLHGLRCAGFSYDARTKRCHLTHPRTLVLPHPELKELRWMGSNSYQDEPLGTHELQRIHHNTHQLDEVLDSCEPGLGKRFKDAVAHTPPRTEPLPNIEFGR